MARGWFQLGTVNPDELAGLRERYFTDDSPSGQRPITPVFFQVRPPAQGFQIAATRVRDCVTLPGVGPSPLPDPVFFRALHGPFSSGHRLSRWFVETIRCAYAPQGLPVPRGHGSSDLEPHHLYCGDNRSISFHHL
jgi:hypothetical protein